jgi:LPXTG-motif cell wall-anchored protein
MSDTTTTTVGPVIEIDVGVVVPDEPDVLDDCGAVCGPASVPRGPALPDDCLGTTTRWTLQPCGEEPVVYPPQAPAPETTVVTVATTVVPYEPPVLPATGSSEVVGGTALLGVLLVATGLWLRKVAA